MGRSRAKRVFGITLPSDSPPKKTDVAKTDEFRYESLPGDAPELYRNLYEVIRSGDRSKLAVKPEETVNVLKLIELVKRSSEEGKIIPVSEA